MEETESLWNKKTTDLTVADVAAAGAAVVLIAKIGIPAADAVVTAVVNKVRSNFQKARTNRQTKHLNVVEK